MFCYSYSCFVVDEEESGAASEPRQHRQVEVILGYGNRVVERTKPSRVDQSRENEVEWCFQTVHEGLDEED